MQQITFGYADENDDFVKRNETFFARFENLRSAFGSTLRLDSLVSEPTDKVLIWMGRLCFEDFSEILLLCANGYGVGAFKLLRGMYERVVTTEYLRIHPDEVDDYIAYGWVDEHKLLKAWENSGFGEMIPAWRREQVEAQYAEVKGRYKTHSWKVDLVQMALKSEHLRPWLAAVYYEGLRHTHPTNSSFLSRLQLTESGTVDFHSKAQRPEADNALRAAHFLILAVMDNLHEHFRPNEQNTILTTAQQRLGLHLGST
ncbi:MAG TPA: DUF5677 domain-containing protein [Bryobacteraceae bacterium]|jgi:hypothetical protein